MKIDHILEKNRAGKALCIDEVKALMLHALDLLRYINAETQRSITLAHSLLGEQCKKAA